MDQLIVKCLSELRLGQLQTHKNLSVFPLLGELADGPDYLLLKEALDNNLITVTEVDKSGHVPELKVINTSEKYVLLLDGEELIGAKQNRVINTTILLKGASETIIPVSCTEEGRWQYTSSTFSNSDVIMARKARAGKAQSVSRSLLCDRSFKSDQGQVWDHIAEFHEDARVASPTRAMKDVYTAKKQDLDSFVRAFECVPGQRGSLVFINGEPAGFDLISRADAYLKLHTKLVKSYAIDTLLKRQQSFEPPAPHKAERFIENALRCRENRFPSTGEGFDFRFEADGLVGSALIFENSIIHLVFFSLDKDERGDSMSGYRQRRNFMRSRM